MFRITKTNVSNQQNRRLESPARRRWDSNSDSVAESVPARRRTASPAPPVCPFALRQVSPVPAPSLLAQSPQTSQPPAGRSQPYPAAPALPHIPSNWQFLQFPVGFSHRIVKTFHVTCKFGRLK